jgi:hypothetical protein
MRRSKFLGLLERPGIASIEDLINQIYEIIRDEKSRILELREFGRRQT